jgi:hypothetical protein
MRTERPVEFVLQMQLKRQALGMGHGAFANYLGIDRSLWYLLRYGQKELSLALIQRVMREWPDEFEPFLREAVLAWRDRAPGDCAEGQEAVREAC